VDKGRRRILSKNWYENNKEHKLKKNKENYQKNKESRLKKNREWYQNNKKRKSIQNAEWRENNTEHFKCLIKQNDASRYEAEQTHRQVSIAWIHWYKENNPCHDCNRYFPHDCLDFDHRDPNQKINNINIMKNRARKVILAEILKCDLVCKICHARRTMKRLHPHLDL
jgi:hypothetical protein